MLIRLAVLNDKLHRKMVSLGIPEEVAAYVSEDSNRFPPATRKFVARALAEELKWRWEHPVQQVPGIEHLTGPITFEQLERRWHDDIIKVRDWLRFAREEDGSHLNMHKYPKWNDMLRAADQWHDNLDYDEGHPALYRHDDPQHTVKVFPDGWRIVNVAAEDLENEGNLMGHCVGGYEDEVEDGTSIIYSLRDPQGTPHVTFEMRKEDVDQREVESEAERRAEKALSEEMDRWEKEEWPEVQKEVTAEFVEERGSREELQAAYEAAEEGSDEEADLRDQLWDWDRDLESTLEARKENEYRWMGEDQFSDPEETREYLNYVREELEKNAPLYCEQIQGKEDQPPLDRYRPYLREFFKDNPSYDTRNVNNRLQDVAATVQKMIQTDRWFDLSDQSVREEDLGPLYEAVIERIFRDPEILKSKGGYSFTTRRHESQLPASMVANAVNYAQQKGGAYWDSFIRKAMETGVLDDYLFPMTGGDYKSIPQDIRYREIMRRLEAAETPGDTLRFLRTFGNEVLTPAFLPLVTGPVLQKYLGFPHLGTTRREVDGRWENDMQSLGDLISNVVSGHYISPRASDEQLAEGMKLLVDLNQGGDLIRGKASAHLYDVAQRNPEGLARATALLPDHHYVSRIRNALQPSDLEKATHHMPIWGRWPSSFIRGYEGDESQPRLPGDRSNDLDTLEPLETRRPRDLVRTRQMIEDQNRFRDRQVPPNTQMSLELEASSRRSLVRLAEMADELGSSIISDRIARLIS